MTPTGANDPDGAENQMLQNIPEPFFWQVALVSHLWDRHSCCSLRLHSCDFCKEQENVKPMISKQWGARVQTDFHCAIPFLGPDHCPMALCKEILPHLLWICGPWLVCKIAMETLQVQSFKDGFHMFSPFFPELSVCLNKCFGSNLTWSILAVQLGLLILACRLCGLWP